MNRIEVTSLDSRLVRFEKPLAAVAKKTCEYLKVQNSTLEIYIVNVSSMKKLHLKYKGKNNATDVLAVESPGFPEVKKRVLGEIYLCPAWIKHKPYTIYYALIHGVLHLLGFNHDKGSDKMEMEKKEKEILQWLDHRS